jgi:hypothetical protein
MCHLDIDELWLDDDAPCMVTIENDLTEVWRFKFKMIKSSRAYPKRTFLDECAVHLADEKFTVHCNRTCSDRRSSADQFSCGLRLVDTTCDNSIPN